MILNIDCLQGLQLYPDNYFDSIVTDPPYELGFMGKSWDATGIAYNVELWKQALRVLKPGGHLLAFSGSRTYHRMTCAIEDAGLEIRDQIMWVYGSGFPKSLDVSKAIDNALGLARNVISERPAYGIGGAGVLGGHSDGATAKVTESACYLSQQWEGWGTALKPAHEPICVARKPLIGTVANNVLEWGTGALNIDASRIEGDEGTLGRNNKLDSKNTGINSEWGMRAYDATGRTDGRWPANFIHDGLSEDWSRFFYCAKASKADREEGLRDFNSGQRAGVGALRDGGRPSLPRKNIHPTVKPTDLMRYLCRLVTPPGGVICDPFTGSGSTGKAAKLEGFDFVGFELSTEYVEIANARIDGAVK